MAILSQFLLRLAFGLAAAMCVVSPRQVTSGYYRNTSYVLLGFNALALLTLWHVDLRYFLIASTVLSYVASACWLYERPGAGRLALVATAMLDLISAHIAGGGHFAPLGQSAVALGKETFTALNLLDVLSGGLVLGVTMAAMLLGHWYLNSPTMELAPLRRLVRLLAASLVLRAVLCAIGLWLLGGPAVAGNEWMLLLRWLSGIAVPLVLVWMTLRTLDIPNTQSATGILYVVVIMTFTGELCAELLSRGALFPL